MTTVISHIYNEEFLLPYWLNHHKNLFDHGIIIDFASSDRSVEIIKEITPHWEIVESPFFEFDSDKLDRFIETIEQKIVGPRIALTVTEFFLGDPSLVTGQLIIPEVSLIQQSFDEPFIEGKQFFEQRKWGLISDSKNVTNDSFTFPKGNGRSLHDHPIRYPQARHFIPTLPSAFLIVRVNDCLATEEMYSRRLQIQKRIPKSDIERGYSVEHTNFGKGLKRDDLIIRQANQQKISVYLGKVIEQALERNKFCLKISRNEDNDEDFLKMWRYAVNNFQYEGAIQPYTAGTSFSAEINYMKESYESSPIFRLTSMIKSLLTPFRQGRKRK